VAGATRTLADIEKGVSKVLFNIQRYHEELRQHHTISRIVEASASVFAKVIEYLVRATAYVRASGLNRAWCLALSQKLKDVLSDLQERDEVLEREVQSISRKGQFLIPRLASQLTELVTGLRRGMYPCSVCYLPSPLQPPASPRLALKPHLRHLRSKDTEQDGPIACWRTEGIRLWFVDVTPKAVLQDVNWATSTAEGHIEHERPPWPHRHSLIAECV
jgi:hypothetical protein